MRAYAAGVVLIRKVISLRVALVNLEWMKKS